MTLISKALFIITLLPTLANAKLRNPIILKSNSADIISLTGTNVDTHRKESYSLKKNSLLSSHIANTANHRTLPWQLSITTSEIETIISYDENNNPVTITRNRQIHFFFSSQRLAENFTTKLLAP